MKSNSSGIEPKRLIKSFSYALSGIRRMLRTEQNARVHLLSTLLVIAAGFFFQVSALEWCVLLLSMAVVWAAEAFNTALETLADHIFKDFHPTALCIKDLAAGAVLVAALAAAVCGLIIFVPKIIAFVH